LVDKDQKKTRGIGAGFLSAIDWFKTSNVNQIIFHFLNFSEKKNYPIIFSILFNHSSKKLTGPSGVFTLRGFRAPF